MRSECSVFAEYALYNSYYLASQIIWKYFIFCTSFCCISIHLSYNISFLKSKDFLCFINLLFIQCMKLFRNRLNIWYIKIRMYTELIYFNRICSINSSINGLSSFSDMHKNGLSNTNFYLFFRLTTIYFFKKHVHIRLLYIFLHIF